MLSRKTVSVDGVYPHLLSCLCPDSATNRCMSQKYIAEQRSGTQGREQKAVGETGVFGLRLRI